MALRARYGPGNRAWSYQRPADDSANGPPPLPSAFGLTLSADEHTPVPESRIDEDAPTQTAADAARSASGVAKLRGRTDGASAARAARAAKTSAARSARASGGGQTAASAGAATGGGDAAPRRRSGRVPATTAKARAVSPTHTVASQRTVKRKRSALAPDAAAGVDTESESALRDGVVPPPNDENVGAEQDLAAPRPSRGSGPKRPRLSQKDLDVKPPRGDEADDSRRTTFGSTTTAPDPFTALSAADLTSNPDYIQSQAQSATNIENPHGANIRRLPPGVPVHRYLTGLYRRYPISQVGLPKEVIADVPDLDTNVSLPPTTIPNAAPFLNLYAPRRTRGIGADKHGLCPICSEPPSRGGRGKAMMLNMKTSAFNYHMQYVHGLSPKTGLPFSPPIAFRSTPRKTVGAREKATLEEGLCHACARWIVIEGVKAVEVLVPEIYWWKHASTCHKSRMLDGEGDFYIEDPLFKRILQWQRDHPAAAGREPARASNANGTGTVAATSVVRKDEPMEIDLNAPITARPGAMTPIRLNQDEPDSSPLSSLDGTDGTRVSPIARKVSAPALQYPPSSHGPFGPPSPSTARARSADTAPAPSNNAAAFPPFPRANALPLETPQLANHALPGTLPGTPQTTASGTPVMPGTALPTVGTAPQSGPEGTDIESRSVVDSGVALSPREQSGKSAEAEGDVEGEDEDAEGEDDPTATEENTPVMSQLSVLTPTTQLEEDSVLNAEQGSVPSAEQGLALNAGQELASLVDPAEALPDPGLGAVGNLSNLGQGSIGDGVQQQDPMVGVEQPANASEAQVPGTEMQLDVQIPDVPIAQVAVAIPDPVVEQAQVPNPTPAIEPPAAIPIEAQPPVQENIIPVEVQQQPTIAPVPVPQPDQIPPVPVEISNMGETAAIPPELPAVQGMDMYAGNATPNGPETSQLALTDEDLALSGSDLALANGEMTLANGLVGAEMSLVGEEAGIPGVGIEMPTDSLEPLSAPTGQGLIVPEPAATVSSGEGTPNTGGEPDIFAFWNA